MTAIYNRFSELHQFTVVLLRINSGYHQQAYPNSSNFSIRGPILTVSQLGLKSSCTPLVQWKEFCGLHTQRTRPKMQHWCKHTHTFEGAMTLKLVILEHLSKLKPYRNETHHGSGGLYSTTITSFTLRVG
jgi:hypothetical protein